MGKKKLSRQEIIDLIWWACSEIDPVAEKCTCHQDIRIKIRSLFNKDPFDQPCSNTHINLQEEYQSIQKENERLKKIFNALKKENNKLIRNLANKELKKNYLI